MKRLAAFTLTLGLSFPSSAGAFSVRIIYAEQAQGTNGSTIGLEVSPGQGLNINFIPTEETIKKVWIDDPSRIALSFDGNLCQWSGNGNQQQECTNSGATVVHLRQIKPINFPNLPRSSTGSTLLTLVTEGADGRKLYQFKVVPISGEPEYTTITIKPDSEKPTPLFNRVVSVTGNSQWQPQSAIYSQQAIRDANAAAEGLAIALRHGQIDLNTTMWKKAQSAIIWLRRGKSREEAASRAKIPLSVLAQLIEWGTVFP